MLGPRGGSHHAAGLAHAQARVAELAGPEWAGGRAVEVSGGLKHVVDAGELGFRERAVLWEGARVRIVGCERRELTLGLLVEVEGGWRLLAP